MPTSSGFWVKVINGEVAGVTDATPPAGDLDWREAVEIRPEINPRIEAMVGHTIDLSKTPIEIVYTKRDVSWQERKTMLLTKIELDYLGVVREEELKRKFGEDLGSYDQLRVLEADQSRTQALAGLNAASSHADIDALNLD